MAGNVPISVAAQDTSWLEEERKIHNSVLLLSTGAIGALIGQVGFGGSQTALLMGGGIGLWAWSCHKRMILKRINPLGDTDIATLGVSSVATMVAPDMSQRPLYFFGGLVAGYLLFKRMSAGAGPDSDPIPREP